jgi:hypothetical protein
VRKIVANLFVSLDGVVEAPSDLAAVKQQPGRTIAISGSAGPFPPGTGAHSLVHSETKTFATGALLLRYTAV